MFHSTVFEALPRYIKNVIIYLVIFVNPQAASVGKSKTFIQTRVMNKLTEFEAVGRL